MRLKKYKWIISAYFDKTYDALYTDINFKTKMRAMHINFLRAVSF